MKLKLFASMSQRDLRMQSSRFKNISSVLESLCLHLSQVEEDAIYFDELEIIGTPCVQMSSKHWQQLVYRSRKLSLKGMTPLQMYF
jgi:hypothetical protein